MSVQPLTKSLYPGSIIKTPDGRLGEYWETLYGYKHAIVSGIAAITQTPQNTIPVKFPPNTSIPFVNGNPITLPLNAVVIRIQAAFPAGLIQATGERLKVANAIAAASVAGTNIAVVSSPAVAGRSVKSDVNSTARWLTSLGVATISTPLAADTDMFLFSANAAGTALGTGVSATQITYVPVRFTYIVPSDAPLSLDQVFVEKPLGNAVAT